MGISNSESHSKVEYLRQIYTDPSHPASFDGTERLKREADRDGKYRISRREAKAFLESQDTYSVNRPVHRRFKRNRIVVRGLRKQYDIDLCDMSNLRRYRGNRGTRYLLVAIDVFSRFAFVRPLKNKSGPAVAAALSHIFSEGHKPARCRSDKGTEFKSKAVQDLLRRLGVKHYFAVSDLKCQPVERLNQTLKSAIYKWCYENKSFAYVTVLDEIVESYNNRVHSALFGLSPSEVNESNQLKLWNLIYTVTSTKTAGESQRVRLFKYKVGDLVRTSLAKKTFERSFAKKFTENIYKIRGRVYRENVPVYFLMDFEEEPIKAAFYEPELQLVQKDLSDMSRWENEKILRTRKIGRNHEVLVRYRGLGPKFDRWISKSSVDKTA